MEYILISLLLLSLISNTFILYRYLKLKSERVKTKTTVKEDLDLLQDLVSDRSRVLIEIRRIAPSSYFIRSPRE